MRPSGDATDEGREVARTVAAKARLRAAVRRTAGLVPMRHDLATRAWTMVRSEAIASRLEECGRAPSFGRHCTWVHPEHVSIGADVDIGAFSRVSTVTSYEGEVFAPSLVLGDRVSIGWYAHLACALEIVIGHDTLIGSHFFVTDHNHGEPDHRDYSDNPVTRRLSPDRVLIGARCWIGERVIVLPGASIGDGCIIGAGSVVRGSIPPGSVAVGVPARPVRALPS